MQKYSWDKHVWASATMEDSPRKAHRRPAQKCLNALQLDEAALLENHEFNFTSVQKGLEPL